MSDPKTLFIFTRLDSLCRSSNNMARFLFLLFIFANALLNSLAVGGAAPPPTSAESPSTRKFGKHRSATVVSSGSGSGPSEAPRSEMKVQATSAAAASAGESGNQIHLESREHRKSRDKSIAGGGVILGGLATTFLVAIICYIRATRRQK